MHSQAQLEHQASDALAALGATIDPGTVSDAVDLYLCKHERETGQPIDRGAIGATVAAEAIETATSWLLAHLWEPRWEGDGVVSLRRESVTAHLIDWLLTWRSGARHLTFRFSPVTARSSEPTVDDVIPLLNSLWASVPLEWALEVGGERWVIEVSEASAQTTYQAG